MHFQRALILQLARSNNETSFFNNLIYQSIINISPVSGNLIFENQHHAKQDY